METFSQAYFLSYLSIVQQLVKIFIVYVMVYSVLFDIFLHSNRLKSYCEKLMFYNPVEYGRKAEEVLWRKVFYDVIQVVKKNKDVCMMIGNKSKNEF